MARAGALGRRRPSTWRRTATAGSARAIPRLARVLVAHAGQLVDAGKFEDARATLERALGLVRGAGDLAEKPMSAPGARGST